ncbi:MAG: hypothetical protein KJZ54_16255 [Phycisphaerales bacterium]|nr:hypothetical protein [Phycisphaerales bacterium]
MRMVNYCLAHFAQFIGALCILSSVGCSVDKVVSARLYDLESGAISQGRFHFTGSTHGRIEVHLSSGELLEGEYNTIPSGTTGWGAIYGRVWTAAVSPNALTGVAIATSPAGTVLECEYITNASRFHPMGHGAARDNRRRVYRLVFGGE